MKSLNYLLLVFALILNSCDRNKSNSKVHLPQTSFEQLPYLIYQKENLFPGTGSLLRVEDGVALEDGHVIVVDQAKGLRLIEKDGYSRPLGNFANAGFVHNPPEKIASPNGLFLEHDGKHILMCDVADGKIYRIDVSSEKVDLIYDHPYGVNSIYCDKTGAIWFTQSTNNTNLEELGIAVNLPTPNGAIFRLAGLKSAPVKIADSLYLANGITMDKEEKKLFVAETMMDRVHSFEVDIKSGKAAYAGVAANVGTPDNILIDNNGRLFVGSPGHNQVVEVDLKNRSQQIIFNASTTENQKMTNEWVRRSHLLLPRAELLTPNLFSPLPGLLTGMFFSKDGQTLYSTNLGNDLLRFNYR